MKTFKQYILENKALSATKSRIEREKQADARKHDSMLDRARIRDTKAKNIATEEKKKMKGKDPCWKDYEMVGMKDKNGKQVPNCVPKEK